MLYRKTYIFFVESLPVLEAKLSDLLEFSKHKTKTLPLGIVSNACNCLLGNPHNIEIMVGVPGKYKGCNTCRARRVKCDNERPFCRKCSASGRECQGYERETVFIVGTVEDKGRCSSHPPRNMKSPKNSPSPGPSEQSMTKVIPTQPLRPAWDDTVCVAFSGKTYRLQILALHLPMVAGLDNGDCTIPATLSLPQYTPMDTHPSFGDEEFRLHCRCLFHISSGTEASGSLSTQGYLLFLYEHNSSLSVAAQGDWMRQRGPGYCTEFPSHHLFTRVYRPSAITTALLNRKPTFLAEEQWLITPWDSHPKSSFDRLLDIASQIPSLLCRVDQLLVIDPTITRRLAAQNLLEAHLDIHRQLETWKRSIYPAYWDSSHPNSEIPFAEVLSFRDPQAALESIFYLAVQLIHLQSIELLVHVIYVPVVDAIAFIPQIHLPFDTAQQTRETAGMLCRSLDGALTTITQPDLLMFAVHVAEAFYASLNVMAGGTGDGSLDLMWLAIFRARLVAKGQEVSEAVVGRQWRELGRW